MSNSTIKKLHVLWKVSALNESIASVRYRALIPILALGDEQYQHTIISDFEVDKPDQFDVVIFVKAFTSMDFMLAQQFQLAGVPIVLDLCDNLFIETYGAIDKQKLKHNPSFIFKQIAALAHSIVVTTEPLALFVKEQVHSTVRVVVIPDGIDNTGDSFEIKQKLIDAIALLKSKNKFNLKKWFGNVRRQCNTALSMNFLGVMKVLSLKALRVFSKNYIRAKALLKFSHNNIERCVDPSVNSASDTGIENQKIVVWFGNHGAPYAQFGMLDLLLIKDPLEKAAKEIPFTLVVISNNRKKYLESINKFNINTEYVEWSPENLDYYLSKASLVVIPNSLDNFSICKSANRSVTSLLRGVPVVATKTPALNIFESGGIYFNDFYSGVLLYLSDESVGSRDILYAKQIIEDAFSSRKISEYWASVLQGITFKPTNSIQHVELIFGIGLIQDVDNLMPLIEKSITMGHSILVYCSSSLCANSPRVLNELVSRNIPIMIVSEEALSSDYFSLPSSLKALITAVESNLGPHSFTKALTERVNKAGLKTATLQHGFENIGLTYDDEFQAIHKIKFYSKYIYIWGPMTSLHPNVTQKNKKRCISVGCVKPKFVSNTNIQALIGRERPIIGIFENLHWLRYSDDYREFFINSIQKLAQYYPEFDFLIKPHNAGLWITNRFQGKLLALDNLIVIDPQSPKWDAFTAPVIINGCNAVITTPSTVALDSARMGIPTAVVAHKLDLLNYTPLPLLKSLQDFYEFIAASQSEPRRACQIQNATDFVKRNLIDGDPTERILLDMLAE